MLIMLILGTETVENRPGMRGGHQMALDVHTGRSVLSLSKLIHSKNG